MGILACQWWSALYFLVKGDALSPATDKFLRITLLVAGCVIAALFLGFGIWQAVAVAERVASTNSFVNFPWTDPKAMGMFVITALSVCLMLALSLFLLVSSIAGFVLLQRKKYAEEQLAAVCRFAVVSALLVFGFSMSVVLVFMAEILIVPEWWFALMRMGSDVLVGGALLYYLFMATRSVHLARVSKSSSASQEMSVELLAADARGDAVPHMYDNI